MFCFSPKLISARATLYGCKQIFLEIPSRSTNVVMQNIEYTWNSICISFHTLIFTDVYFLMYMPRYANICTFWMTIMGNGLWDWDTWGINLITVVQAGDWVWTWNWIDLLIIKPFHELRRYYTRPLRLNWGPENVHFGKRRFWDLNINVRIF